MQISARRTLRRFREIHPQAARPLKAWFAVVSKAAWRSPAEIKLQCGGTVDFVVDNRVIFDVGGDKYRIVVHVAYRFNRVLIKFVGTHGEYDRIDPESV